MHCESQNTSLMRYDTYITDTVIRNMHFVLALDLGEIMFLGLQKKRGYYIFFCFIYMITNEPVSIVTYCQPLNL